VLSRNCQTKRVGYIPACIRLLNKKSFYNSFQNLESFSLFTVIAGFTGVATQKKSHRTKAKTVLK